MSKPNDTPLPEYAIHSLEHASSVLAFTASFARMHYASSKQLGGVSPPPEVYDGLATVLEGVQKAIIRLTFEKFADWPHETIAETIKDAPASKRAKGLKVVAGSDLAEEVHHGKE